MRIKSKLIPDSSFFICFFDDLEDLISETERFGFIAHLTKKFFVEIPECVHYEADFKSRNYDFSDLISIITIDDFATEGWPFEPLRMVLDKGEFEVIVLSYVNKISNTSDFIFILDENTARKYVRLFLPFLVENLKGTIGFLDYLEQNNYLTPEFTINALESIGKSKFRINKEILDTAIKNIKRRRYG